jgi:hypothetical protein
MQGAPEDIQLGGDNCTSIFRKSGNRFSAENATKLKGYPITKNPGLARENKEEETS